MANEKSVGIIGYGDIGMNIAKRLKCGLQMKIRALVRDPSKLSEEKKSYLDEMISEDKVD